MSVLLADPNGLGSKGIIGDLGEVASFLVSGLVEAELWFVASVRLLAGWIYNPERDVIRSNVHDIG